MTPSTDLMRIATALEQLVEKTQPEPEPVFYAADGHVNLKDYPEGATVVRCSLEMIRAMNGPDPDLGSIAEELKLMREFLPQLVPPVFVDANSVYGGDLETIKAGAIVRYRSEDAHSIAGSLKKIAEQGEVETRSRCTGAFGGVLCSSQEGHDGPHKMENVQRPVRCGGRFGPADDPSGMRCEGNNGHEGECGGFTLSGTEMALSKTAYQAPK